MLSGCSGFNYDRLRGLADTVLRDRIFEKRCAEIAR